MRFLGIAAIALTLLSFPGAGRAQVGPRVRITTSGSVPEIPELFGCMRGLEKEPYSQARIVACRNEAISTTYFSRVEYKTKRLKEGIVEITFRLESPPLTVRELRINGAGEEVDALRDWLQRNQQTIHEGGTYTRWAEVSTKAGIERYYASKGIQVGVTSTVQLNYLDRSARLELSIARGPTQPIEPALPPYSPACPDPVRVLDWTDFNRYVPVALVRASVALRDAGVCFSEDKLAEDRDSLERLGLFTKVLYTASGIPPSRQLSLSLIAAPLKVSDVTIEKYGFSDTVDQEPDIPLKIGDTYTAESARETIDRLKAFFASDRSQISVSEKDQLVRDHLLQVSFRVLKYGSDRLLINDRSISGQPWQDKVVCAR